MLPLRHAKQTSKNVAETTLNGEEISRMFYEKELQKTNQKDFRVAKVIKRKDNKIYVK